MVGTLSLGPSSDVRDVWQNLEDIGYCFELKTVSDRGEAKTNIFMVSCSAMYTRPKSVDRNQKLETKTRTD